MRKNSLIWIGVLALAICFASPQTAKAQHDTTKASKNTHHAVFSQQGDGKIVRDTSQNALHKAVGNGIPHLTLFNLAQQTVPVKLSFDAKKWTAFELKPRSKNLYRCDKSPLYIIIDPQHPDAVKAKLTVHKKYKIFYYHELQMLDIYEIP